MLYTPSVAVRSTLPAAGSQISAMSAFSCLALVGTVVKRHTAESSVTYSPAK